MGAETRVYCKVQRRVYEWVEVYAVTLDEAFEKARHLPDVWDVVEVTYDPSVTE